MAVDFKNLKVALVHDYLNQYGGAERVLESIIDIFPNAPIYTLIYYKKRVGDHYFKNKKIYTSFLQKIPFIKLDHRYFLYLMPLAISQFDFREFDIVISQTASFAKGIKVPKNVLHISYCHTPTRYLWEENYLKEAPHYPFFLKPFIKPLINLLKKWDYNAARKVDYFIANSNNIAAKIKKFYNRDSIIVYPGVNTEKFYIDGIKQNYYLAVGRLLFYKRFDLMINVFNKLGLPLKIIGSGPEEKRLKKIAKNNIEFIGRVDDESLRKYCSGAEALIFPQDEDFGLVPLEAMACGTPVIAYFAGGAKETVIDGKTGIFFYNQTEKDLEDAIKKFELMKGNFNSEVIRGHALNFDEKIFKENFKNKVVELYDKHRKENKNRH